MPRITGRRFLSELSIFRNINTPFLISCLAIILLVSVPALGAAQTDDLAPLLDSIETLMFEREYELAIEECNGALQLYPENLEIRGYLFEAYFNSNDFENALEEQMAIIEIEPSEDAYNKLGLTYDNLDDDANKLYALHKAATGFGSGSEYSWEQLAIAYVHVKLYGGAVHAYRKTLAFNPDNYDARFQLIRNLWRTEEYKAAAYEISQIYETKTERFYIGLWFLRHFVPPLLLLVTLLFLFKNRRLSYVFCNTPATKADEIFVDLRSIMIIFALYFFLPYLAFNPFSPYYPYKVITSMYLYRNPAGFPWTWVPACAISLLLVPMYYMKKNGISITSLFALDANKLKTILIYVLLGIALNFVWVIPASIYFMIKYPSGPSEIGWPNKDYYQALPLSAKLCGSIVFPFLEEVGHRGMIFPLLRKHFKTFFSILFSSLLFAAFHYTRSIYALAGIFAFGMVAAYLVHKTKSLWPSFILHVIMNSAIFFS